MKNSKIQIVRAILALIVVMIHAMPSFSVPRIIARPFLNIAVAGFIFLSGFLTKTNVETKKIYKKRIMVSLIPYMLFTIFYTIGKGYKAGVGISLASIGKNLITTQGSGVLYYLVVYIQLVLLTPLLVRIARQKKWFLNLPVLIIQPLFLLFFYLGIINGDILKEAPYYMMFFPVWLTYYYLGILIGNDLLKIKTKNSTLIVLVAIGIVLQITEGFFWLNNTSVKDMYYSQIRITALLENIPLLLLITRYIRSKKEKTNKLLCKIGDASFGIYLLHPALIMICDKLIPRSETTFMITYLFAVIGSFAIVLILNKIVPKKALKYTGLGLK